MNRYIFIALGIIVSSSAHSQSPEASWLPDEPCCQSGIRLLGCRYDGPRLVGADEITADSPDWEVTATAGSHLREGESSISAYDYSLVFKAKRALESPVSLYLSTAPGGGRWPSSQGRPSPA